MRRLIGHKFFTPALSTSRHCHSAATSEILRILRAHDASHGALRVSHLARKMCDNTLANLKGGLVQYLRERDDVFSLRKEEPSGHFTVALRAAQVADTPSADIVTRLPRLSEVRSRRALSLDVVFSCFAGRNLISAQVQKRSDEWAGAVECFLKLLAQQMILNDARLIAVVEHCAGDTSDAKAPASETPEMLAVLPARCICLLELHQLSPTAAALLREYLRCYIASSATSTAEHPSSELISSWLATTDCERLPVRDVGEARPHHHQNQQQQPRLRVRFAYQLLSSSKKVNACCADADDDAASIALRLVQSLYPQERSPESVVSAATAAATLLAAESFNVLRIAATLSTRDFTSLTALYRTARDVSTQPLAETLLLWALQQHEGVIPYARCPAGAAASPPSDAKTTGPHSLPSLLQFCGADGEAAVEAPLWGRWVTGVRVHVTEAYLPRSYHTLRTLAEAEEALQASRRGRRDNTGFKKAAASFSRLSDLSRTVALHEAGGVVSVLCHPDVFAQYLHDMMPNALPDGSPYYVQTGRAALRTLVQEVAGSGESAEALLRETNQANCSFGALRKYPHLFSFRSAPTDSQYWFCKRTKKDNEPAS